MKNSSQITGLPIISIADGQQIGAVKTLVINPEKGTIDFLTIEHEDWQVSVKAIPFKKVVGIGEYAITVETDNAVIDLNEIPIANQLVNKKIKINQTKVMTRKGALLGEVIEFYADDETGQILGMDLLVGEKQVTMPSEYVLTYGKDIVIVKEDAEQGFLENHELLEAEKSVELDTIHQEEAAASEEQNNVQLDALKNKQVELLVGKKVIKDIVGLNGQVFIPAGTILTEDKIHSAQTEGPAVLIELAVNVE
ncbi:PRC-barrel domain-containing protein [Cytobacillus gottheilii]|uniref:PRC-barrel domain-containing protein n=1 Tax=Cytobacillus gottheilii TaxID=859144 RepID=UPI0009BAF94F|nr:PRC-barrel domain-containing protein [Cytobacillus gottheilii]